MKNTHVVHWVMQGKGGVGKSTKSAWLLEYFVDRKIECQGLDIDSVQKTLGSFKALPVEQVDVMGPSRTVLQRKFDPLMDGALEAATKGHAVVDVGSSEFLPVCHYLIENRVFEVFAGEGIEVVVHVPIVGGQSLDDNLYGFGALVGQMCKPFGGGGIAWLDEMHGPVEPPPFDEQEVYRSNADHTLGVIRVPKRGEETFGADLAEMLSKSRTFGQSIEAADRWSGSRLSIIRKGIWDQLDRVLSVDEGVEGNVEGAPGKRKRVEKLEKPEEKKTA